VSTFIEAPLQLQQTIRFPDVMAQQCQMQNIPIVGNAANHTEGNGGLFDLTGEPSAPPPLPGGFTAKGYGAMAGCCIAAVIGLLTIMWYGLTESPKGDRSSENVNESNSSPAFVDQ
jgi:iron transport multicopper oxidase